MDLIIGKTSQLGILFPDDCVKISSRGVICDTIKNYDTVYITFAEQRTFNKELSEKDFIDINVKYTSELVDKIYKFNGKVIIYGTFELWNAHNGPVSIETAINYNYSPYIKSKEILYNLLLEKKNREEWLNVFIIHPTNFNTTNRKSGFLFSKIFDSIINKTHINVGDLNINRDLIHAKYLVEKSINCNEDMIVASGILTNLRDFVKTLYSLSGLNYIDYVTEDITAQSPHKTNNFWLDTQIKYNDLIKDTIDDIKAKRQNNVS